MLRALLLEDEAPARDHLARLVSTAATPCTIVGAVDSLAALTAWLRTHPAPDLLFADIQLGDGLSLDHFRATPPPCPVIFVTAHDDYLLAAFATHGLAYLLKPLKRPALDTALAKYRDLARHFAIHFATLATSLAATPSSASLASPSSPSTSTPPVRAPRQRLLAQRGSTFQPVAVADIAYFFSENKLTFLVTRTGERCLVNDPLSTLATDLAPADFFRLNRTHLAHSSAVKTFTAVGKGRLSVQLVPRPATEVLVSQETAAAFRTWAGR
jgi:two-component system LytT family response regulator